MSSVRILALGVPPAERDKVIFPFWSQNMRSTGLGLAIAHESAEARGGRITCYSEPGRGSRFRLVIPEVATIGGETSAA